MKRTTLLSFAWLAACSPTPASTVGPTTTENPTSVASPAAHAPSACDVAASTMTAATSAEDEGRLARAERMLASAGAMCPALRSDAEAARARVMAALEDATGDAAGIPTSVNDVDDYHAAARAFLDGRLDEAKKGGLAVARTKGRLAVEARILVARLAEARHDEARARRWFARALHGIGTREQAALKPEAPRSDLFAWTASIPGFHAWKPSCMDRAQDDSRPVAFTPDRSVALFGTPDGVALRTVPGRVLLDERALTGGAFVCFNDAARATVTYEGGLEIKLAQLTGAAQTIKVADPLSLDVFGFVGADGSAFLPKYLDNDKTAEWYRAAPGDKVARKLSLPVVRGAVVPLLLRDGTFLGFEGKAEETMMLARFDPKTARRIEPIAKVDTGASYVQTSDGTRLVYLDGADVLVVVDLAAKSAKKLDHYPSAFPFGLIGSTTAVTQDGILMHAVAQDLTTGALTWSGVIDRFQNVNQSGRRLLALLPEDILAVDLASGSIVRYAIPSAPPKRDAPQRTHAALSDDGAFLITGIAGETTIFDVRDPAAPKVVTTFPVHLLDASFSPGSSVARMFVDAQPPRRAYDAAQRNEVPFVAGDIGPLPVPRDRIAALGQLEPNLSGNVCAFDEATSTVAVCKKDYIALARPVNGRFEAVRLTFSFGRPSGMAMDEHGYYDFFGSVPASFRASATCGGEQPIEVCSDRFEAPGLLQKFLRGDLSYRAP
jgi:hypothetical protein